MEEPYFPSVSDANEINQAAIQASGQTNHQLLRPEVLDGALGRAQNNYYYGNGTHEQKLASAAGALAHGIGAAQSFEDGNKRTAYWTTHHFLHSNGLSDLAPEDDEELADHLIGHGEGTHTGEDTQNLFLSRLNGSHDRVESKLKIAIKGDNITYIPGQKHKGLVDPDYDAVYTWPVDKWGAPHHWEWAANNFNDGGFDNENWDEYNRYKPLTVNEHGSVEAAGSELDPRVLQRLPGTKEADPTEDFDWRFGRRSNILDPIHKGLDPRVWDNPESPEPKLKNVHRHWIERKILNVLKTHGYHDASQWVSLVLTGSLTTYQYSDESDVDVSVFVNSEVFPEWSRAELIGLMVENVDGTKLPGTPFPMQCFVVASTISKEDLYQPGLRSGYDLTENKWIVPPERNRSHDVQSEQNGEYTFALETADKMERLLRYEPQKAEMLWHQLHKKRQRDQKAGKGDYALSNIVYKFLANRGLFKAISAATGEYIAKVGESWSLPEPTKDEPEDPPEVNHTWRNKPKKSHSKPSKASSGLDSQSVLDQNAGQDLQGLPGSVNVPGTGRLQFHSSNPIQQVARSYVTQSGIGDVHPTDYTRVDPSTSTRIAQEYDRMPHDPNDPQVKASYDALARETKSQYDHAVNNGYNFEFYPKTHDPYPNSPREAVLDLHHNNHMYVYPTNDGFGSTEAEEYPDHPLLGDSGVRWGGQPVTHNDLFRAVHDFYGHAKEGLGFRADGEDNAWRQHAAMFSPLARRAMTAETRGQNSWVNYGPHGEHNQTAGQDDTVFAPQKAGLLPNWVEDPELHKGAQAPTFSSWINSMEHVAASSVGSGQIAKFVYDPVGNHIEVGRMAIPEGEVENHSQLMQRANLMANEAQFGHIDQNGRAETYPRTALTGRGAKMNPYEAEYRTKQALEHAVSGVSWLKEPFQPSHNRWDLQNPPSVGYTDGQPPILEANDGDVSQAPTEDSWAF